MHASTNLTKENIEDINEIITNKVIKKVINILNISFTNELLDPLSDTFISNM